MAWTPLFPQKAAVQPATPKVHSGGRRLKSRAAAAMEGHAVYFGEPVGKQSHRKLFTLLPLVFAATFLVAVGPMLLVLWLRQEGVVESIWVGMAIGVAMSFLVSYAGGALWKTRAHSRDILFSELMLWGWVARWRSERRLAAASDLLGLGTDNPKSVPDSGLTQEQRADLLTQLSLGLEARDPYTHGHSRRVARHAENIAKGMGLPREEVVKVRAAGAMHDVGKVDTPTAVLHKEGRLTDEEYDIVKRHPADGAAMVAMLEDDELTAMVRNHHERLDGTGYPDRLGGEAIPVGARIIAVADTFDAITSTRPYRKASAHRKALDILVAEAGTQLDPEAVRAFCRCYAGRRPLAFWTILANGRPRLLSYLGGGLGTANSGALGSVMATAATTAAVGGVAVGALVPAADGAPRTVADSVTPAAVASPARRQAATPGHSPQPRRSKPAKARPPRIPPAVTVPIAPVADTYHPPRARRRHLQASDLTIDAISSPGDRWVSGEKPQPDTQPVKNETGNGTAPGKDKPPKGKPPKNKPPKNKPPKNKPPKNKPEKAKDNPAPPRAVPKGQLKDGVEVEVPGKVHGPKTQKDRGTSR